MPKDLVLVRHGQSEGNIVQRAFKDGPGMEIPPGFNQTHDWLYRLTPEGIEQAKAAGQWLLREFGPLEVAFDERYTSSYIRTRETAIHIGGPACTWLIDDRLTERDWGIYNAVPPNERDQHFPHTQRIREQSSLRWRPDGGEALMSEVLLRFRNWLDTLHREQSNKRVMAVTHGELMWVARYVIERMLPEEWEAVETDKSQRIFNCDIIWYSRTNPKDPDDVTEFMSWRRIIRPTDEANSPYDGQWVKLDGKRRLSGDQLAKIVESIPHIFPRTEIQA